MMHQAPQKPQGRKMAIRRLGKWLGSILGIIIVLGVTIFVSWLCIHTNLGSDKPLGILGYIESIFFGILAGIATICVFGSGISFPY